MPHTQHDINLTFLSLKCFDTSSLDVLNNVLQCLKATEAERLMHGKPTGDPFDIMVGEMRRPMLIASVEAAIKAVEVS
jgi:hypothetical protein